MRKLTGLLALITVGLMALPGCQLNSKNRGALFLEFGTRIALGHENQDTHSEAEIKLQSQPLEEYLRARRDATNTGDVGSNSVPAATPAPQSAFGPVPQVTSN